MGLSAGPLGDFELSVDSTINKDVLADRHAAAVCDDYRAVTPESATAPALPPVGRYALYLLDVEERMAAWYAGAERIYGYHAEEALGHHVALLYPIPTTGVGALLEFLHGVQTDIRGRPFRDGSLAGPKRRLAILGKYHDRSSQGRTRRPAGLCESRTRL